MSSIGLFFINAGEVMPKVALKRDKNATFVMMEFYCANLLYSKMKKNSLPILFRFLFVFMTFFRF
jgi:hypothetical protein